MHARAKPVVDLETSWLIPSVARPSPPTVVRTSAPDIFSQALYPRFLHCIAFCLSTAAMEDIAPEYDVVVMGTGRLPHVATKHRSSMLTDRPRRRTDGMRPFRVRNWLVLCGCEL